MRLIVSMIIATVLGFFLNVASNFVTPHLEKRQRLVWSILISLIVLSIVFMLIPEYPNENQKSKISTQEITSTPTSLQSTLEPVATYWKVAGSSETAIVREGGSSSLFNNRVIITVTRVGFSDVDFIVGAPTFIDSQILKAKLSSITQYDADRRYEIRLTEISNTYVEFLVTPLESH